MVWEGYSQNIPYLIQKYAEKTMLLWHYTNFVVWRLSIVKYNIHAKLSVDSLIVNMILYICIVNVNSILSYIDCIIQRSRNNYFWPEISDYLGIYFYCVWNKLFNINIVVVSLFSEWYGNNGDKNKYWRLNR